MLETPKFPLRLRAKVHDLDSSVSLFVMSLKVSDRLHADLACLCYPAPPGLLGHLNLLLVLALLALVLLDKPVLHSLRAASTLIDALELQAAYYVHEYRVCLLKDCIRLPAARALIVVVLPKLYTVCAEQLVLALATL